MRIITEDNIDQIENLSFSKNIQKLTHTEHLDTKETIDQVQRDIRVLLRESNKGKFVIEDTEEYILSTFFTCKKLDIINNQNIHHLIKMDEIIGGLIFYSINKLVCKLLWLHI